MAEPWEPASTDVAAHLRRYAVDSLGVQQDDFGAATTIRLDDVQRAIASAVGDVIAAAGPIPDADLDPTSANGLTVHDLARSVAALGAAAEAVIDLNPELAAELRDMYEARLARLTTIAADARDGEIDGPGSPPPTWCGPAPFRVDRRAF